MVESVSVDDAGHVAVTILLTVSGCPLKDTLTKDTTAALARSTASPASRSPSG